MRIIQARDEHVWMLKSTVNVPLALLILGACSIAAFGQYVPTPRTYTDAEIGLVLQTPVANNGKTYSATGQYAIGFVVANPNTTTPFDPTGTDSLPASSIKGWHGVLQHWAAAADHNVSFDKFDELQAYEADEIQAGRAPLLITRLGNPVYYDNSSYPYGKQPIEICDPRFVRFFINEHVRKTMLTPSSPGSSVSPQYPNGWQSLDEGFFLYSIYGAPGGLNDGATWDTPFAQNQAQWNACTVSFWAQSAALAPDVQFVLNEGSRAEDNGTVNNHDLSLFQRLYASNNLNIDRETFFPLTGNTSDREIFYNLIQNHGWLLSTGRTALWRQLVDTSIGQIETSALAYLVAKNGNSFFSEGGAGSVEIDPNNATFAWAPVYDQLGNPTSAVTIGSCVSGGSDYSNALYSRTFEGGIVYFNQCGSTQVITLPAGTWYNSAGSVVTSLTIADLSAGIDTLAANYVTSSNGARVQRPQISPLGNGVMTGPVTVTITEGTPSSVIHYTTDGSSPTCSSTTYSAAFNISTTTTITAIGCDAGFGFQSWEDKTTITVTSTPPAANFVLPTDSATPFFAVTYAAVTLSNPSASSVTVNYTVAGDSNISFSPSSGSITFKPFETAKAFPISASLQSSVAIDNLVATLANATGATIGAGSTYTYTIKRNRIPAVTNAWVELHPTAFGQGRSDIPADNQNAATAVIIGGTTAPANFRTIWQFNLGSIPANATITKATMLGYIPTFTDTAANQITTSAFRVLNSWSQSTVNWSNFLSSASNWAASATATTNAIAGNVTGNSSAALGLDMTGNHYIVTADAQNIVKGTNPNNGWVLIGPEGSSGTETFKLLTSNSQPPPGQASLYVQYSIPAPCIITVTSPTVSQVVSGVSLTLGAFAGNCPTLSSVEWIIDGDSQGIVWSIPWSLLWNTNLRSNGPGHNVFAIGRDALGNTLATSTINTFSIANTWLEAPSYISLTSVTPTIPTNSNWYGVVAISAVIGGTNNTNTKTMAVLIDDNYSTYTPLSASTATTMLANVDTRPYVDGVHQVCVELRDTGGAAGTLGGFPFGDWCALVTFANKSTALLVNIASGLDSTSTNYTSFATSAAPLSSGNFVLGCVKVTGTGVTLSLSDTASNSWTALTKTDDGTQTLQCFWSNNVTGGGSNVYTLSSSSNFSHPSMVVRQYSNVSASSPLDVSIQSSGTAGTCPCTITSGTFSTAQPNEVIAVFEATEVSGVSYFAGPGYAEDILANSLSESQTTLATVTNGTAKAYQTNGSSTKWQMAVVSIKAAGTIALPSWLTLSPKEWVIVPGGTQQLTPTLANTDGSTSPAAGPTTFSVADSTICTVSLNGLVTGVAFGNCAVTAIAGNGLSETIHGYVSGTNAIPHFGTDGQIHTTPVPGTDLWAASMFQVTGSTSFADPAVNQSQYGIPYAQAGFKLYEGPLTDANTWNSSQPSFTANLSTFMTNALSPLNTYNLYYYGQIAPLVGGDALYTGTHGLANGYIPAGWTLLANTWEGTGRLMAIAGPDQSDNGRPYPLPNSVMGGDVSSISCTVSASPVCTINLSNAKGPAYNGTQQFIITGATTNSVFNNAPGGTFYSINVPSITANSYTFDGPAGASGLTANASTDPNLIVEVFANKWYPGNDYTRYTAYQTAKTQIAAASPAPPLAGEPGAAAIADPVTGPSWSSWGTFEDIYQAGGAIASEGNPQYSSLYDLIDPNNGTSAAKNFRKGAWYSILGSPRAWMGLTSGTPLNYGFGGPAFNVSISGSTVTFPSPHGIGILYTNVAKAVVSGSANTYFNGNFYIDSCPTATTCTISRATPSSSPVNTPNFGTLTFANGSTWAASKMQNNGAFTYSTQPANCFAGTQPFLANNRNVTFTYAGSGADPYWTTNTFIFEGFPIPSNYNCQLIWHEVPPASQTTASATFQFLNQNYTKGNGQTNPYETLMGPRKPFAGITLAAILGATGHRMYQAGADYIISAQSGGANDFGGAAGTGCTAAQAFANCIQAGLTPLYANGDTGAVADFWATAPAKLLLQRFATAGYLYAARAGTPDLGFNIKSSFRTGSKGKLLLTLNLQDGPQTHTVDISGCAVAGQKTIRYTADWSGISIAVISAGVTTDGATWPAGGAVIYLCSNNSSAEYSAPSISTRLQDVPNAAKIAVQYAYTPYHLNLRTASVSDCGTGTCTLPVDRRIGTIYYRIEYLDVNGVLLATSDVQVI